VKISIRNGRIINPASAENQRDTIADIAIEDGKIIAVGKLPAGFDAEREIDATNLIVCPGLIDLRAHLREPGQEHKATIASESHAAASAGITTLCCPPDTQPIIDTPAVATLILDQAANAGLAKVLPLGALTQNLAGKQLSEMAALKAAGCVGVSNAMRPMADYQVARRALQYAATHGLTVFIHAEDPALSNNGCAHEGAVATRLGLPGIPTAAETVAVASYLALIEATGARAHFSMLTTASAVTKVARARYDGLPVSADVSAHHLHLTELDLLDFDSQCHVQPPLRTQRDCDALQQGLANGTLGAICSDHQPHENDAKLAPFSATAAGISGLETLLPLSLKLGEHPDMDIVDVIRRLTSGPAEILGIEAGNLTNDQTADICIFDPEHYWTLTHDNIVSRGHNSPFLNWELKGKVTHTLLNGKIIYEA